MTKFEFLEIARDRHGYKYEYPNLSDKILSNDIIDVFYNGVVYRQRVVKHIYLGRCPEKNIQRKTTSKFIEESILVWGDKYDYSLVDYKGALKKVKIIYDGVTYDQVAISHLNKMSPELNLNLESFIKRANDKWGDKYDYSLVIFNKMSDKVKIIFNDKVYEQSPNNHLMYSPEKIINIKTNDDFINQCEFIHNFKYDYTKTKYTLSKNKVIIVCPIHGEFKQVANLHFSGQGCRKCVYLSVREKKIKKITEDFIEEGKSMWGDKYDYSLTEYKTDKIKVKIIYDGVEYFQNPLDHFKYPVEVNLDIVEELNVEKEISEFLNRYNIHSKRNHKFEDCRNILPLRFDFYIPSMRVCIEFDGSQHTKLVDVYENLKINDKIKNDYCEDHFINMIRIRHNQVDKISQILFDYLKIYFK